MPTHSPHDRRLARRAVIAAAVVLAFALRLPDGSFPPGLYRDEAWYGIDAARTLVEGPRLWYPANNGREPLFIWLVAPFVALLGHSPAAVRLPAALAGTIAVAAIAPLGAALAGRRASAYAAWLLAVLPWAVILSRTGLRAALVPAAALVATGAIAHAIARPTGRRFAGAGALAGLTLYTYTAALALPLLALVGGLILRAERAANRAPVPEVAQSAPRPRRDPRWRRLAALWLAGAMLVSAPLGVAIATTPGALVDRIAQVSIARTAPDTPVEPGGTGRPPVRRALDGALAAAGLFAVRGDGIPRHNIVSAAASTVRPALGRPAFGLPAALLWATGLLWAMRRAAGVPGRRRAAARILLAAYAITLLPTALAEDAPHFLRAVAAMPLGVLTAAAGASALAGAAAARLRASAGDRRGRARAARAATAALLAIAIAVELRATARHVASEPAAGQVSCVGRGSACSEDILHLPWSLSSRRTAQDFAFEGGATDLARAVNTDLGAGWRGGWTGSAARARAGDPTLDPSIEGHRDGSPPHDPSDDGRRDGSADLVGASDAGSSGADDSEAPHDPPPPPHVWLDRRLRDGWPAIPFLVPIERLTLADPYDPVLDRPGTAYLVPEDLDLDRLWSQLLPDARLILAAGPEERGDLAPRARTMWVRVEAVAAESPALEPQPPPATQPASPPAAPRASPSESPSEPHAEPSPGVEPLPGIAHPSGVAPSPSGLRFAGAEVRVPSVRVPSVRLPLVPSDDANDGEVEVEVATRWIRVGDVPSGLTLFVHVREPEGQFAGADAPPGFGVFPVERWSLGRDVTEVRRIRVPGGLDPARDRIFVGLYAWPSTDPLPIADAAGAPLDAELLVWPETDTR